MYYSALYEENRRTNFFVTTDIDEAILLADRLLVMSNIPTQVRAVIDVDVRRPRKLLKSWKTTMPMKSRSRRSPSCTKKR